MANDPLRELYRTISGEGSMPIEPDHPYYVPILESTPEKDPILALWQRIEFEEYESINLLTGFRGNGKSTELRRLRKMLRQIGCKVYLVNMLDYVIMTRPIELSDFILSLMAALAVAVEKDEDENLKPLSTSFLKDMHDFLLSEVKLENIGFSVKGPGGAAKLGMKLKTDTNFKTLVQDHLKGQLTYLVESARNFIKELITKIREQAGDPGKKVVLLVDSLEQIRGSGDDAEKIYSSVVELFSGEAANLTFPMLHVVYTVPPYLPALSHNLSRILGGNPITQWPNIHIREKDNSYDNNGIAIMKSIIEKRFAGWRDIVPTEFMEEFAKASGGDLRDFFRLVRESVINLKTIRLAREDAVLDKTIVERVIRQLKNELLPIARDDAKWLLKIYESKKESLATDKELPSLARFLDSNLIMNYMNGEPWYDIHPLIVDEIQGKFSPKVELL